MKSLILVCLLVCGTLANPFAEPKTRHDTVNVPPHLEVGNITLPTEVINGTKFYSPNEEHSWKFDLNQDNYVVLSSHYFELELSKDCMFDSLRLVEMNEETKICGQGPFTYISKSNNMDMIFTSDESYEGQGFQMNYDIQKKGDIHETGGCNSSIVEGQSDEIFDTGDVCFYRLQALPGQLLELDLKMIDFGSKPCDDESIKIYRGASTHGTLLTELCSDQIPGVIKVFEEKVFIEYRRADNITETHNTTETHNITETHNTTETRFRLRYSSVENTLTTTTAPITTPSPVGGDNVCSGFFKDKEEGFEIDFPHYEDYTECIVVIRNNLFHNRVIQVTFQDFDLEESEGCVFDSLKVLSGEQSDSYPLGGPYCGTSLNGRTFLSQGNSLRLGFKTDESFALYGLTAKIDFVSRTDCYCDDPSKVCVKTGFEKKCYTGEPCKRPCLNGGTCLDNSSSIQCYCRDGYSGEDCSIQETSGVIRFTTEPKSQKILRGTSVVETCSVEGDALYDWTINGIKITPFDGKKGFGIKGNKHLQINSFDEKAEGEYTCTATVGDKFATIVFEYELVETCIAKITEKPSDNVANKGDPVIFVCKVYNATKVLWRKERQIMDINNMDRFDLLPGGSSLKIYPVQKEDEGEYMCEAVDANQCRIQRSASLTVTVIEELHDYCGRSVYDEAQLTSRINRGKEARPRENPWQVTMLKTDGSAFCGASVISQKYILTAAHCIKEWFDAKNVTLVLGTTDCTGKNAKDIRHPSRVIKHPDFDLKKEPKYDYDIALIELNERIEYGNYIRPVCLQRKEFYYSNFFEGRTKLTGAYAKVAGCGEGTRRKGVDRNAMMEVNLPYVSRDACEEAYEGKSTITENMLCAGFTQRFKGDACQGDSGGALVMSDDRRWYQTGIVSHGMGCDRADFYGVFTNVGNFYDWIRDNTGFDQERVEKFKN